MAARPTETHAGAHGSVLDHPWLKGYRWYDNPLLHLVLLAGILMQRLAVSWRMWPDALIDTGRELYLPWRLSEGAVLYRDVDDFYGPLSQYFNAGLFKLFGPGMIVLAYANIALFSVMALVLYRLLRKAWGGLAAFLGTALLIAVFGFSRLTTTGGFNYALPYSHETTHGILVLLLLVWFAQRWLAKPDWRSGGAMGLMLGLALVLKAEIILAAVVVCAGVAVFNALAEGPFQRGALVAFGAGAVLPTAAFFAYFCVYFPWWEALTAAGRAWFNVLGTGKYVGEVAQLNYSGLDDVGKNLGRHLVATLSAVGVFAVLAVSVAKVKQMPAIWRKPAAGLLIVVAASGSLLAGNMWVGVGSCLLGLQLVYAGYLLFRARRERLAALARDEVYRLRWLLLALGVALMARMVLNGRIHQFGYYQAAIGAVVVLAVLVGELPERARLALAWERRTLRLAVVALLAAGIFCAARRGQHVYDLLHTSHGEGRDKSYIWNNQGNLSEVVRTLALQPPGNLVVLPEGLMINYLARRASPVAPFFFYSVTTAGGREAEIVKQLKANPPEWVVLMPRDLTEYGIRQYGERSGAGAELLEWVRQDYYNALNGRAPEFVPTYIYIFRHRSR